MKSKVSLIYFLLLPILSSFVYARESFMPEILEKGLQFIFIDLSRYAASGNQVFVIYGKFLLWILLFSVFNFVLGKRFDKKVAGTSAFVIALISTLLIPSKLLLFIFNTYSTAVGFLLALLPVFLGMFFAHSTFSRDDRFSTIIRGIIYLAMAIVTFALVGTVSGFEGPLYDKIAKWAGLGGTIALMAGIIVLIKGIGGGGAGATGATSSSSSFLGGWSPSWRKDREAGQTIEKIEETTDKASEQLKKTGESIDAAGAEPEKVPQALKNVNDILPLLGKISEYINKLDSIDQNILEWQASMIVEAEEEKKKLEKQKQEAETKHDTIVGLALKKSIDQAEKNIKKIEQDAEAASATAQKMKEKIQELRKLIVWAEAGVKKTKEALQTKKINDALNENSRVSPILNNIESLMKLIKKYKTTIGAIIGMERIAARKERKGEKKIKEETAHT